MKPTNLYATDGKCHNAEPGTFNHECGKPATWLGTDRNGFTSGFCDDCKARGYEARPIVTWEKTESRNALQSLRPAPILQATSPTTETVTTGPDLSKPYCYYIDPTQTPHPQHGYIPSIVVEGEPGHYPLAGRGPHAVPWYWGDLETAKKIAAEQNARLGIDENETLRIISTSMAASR